MKTSDLRPKRLQMGQNSTVSVSSTSVPATPNPPPTLLDFVSSTPPSLMYELVALAPYIRVMRQVLEIVSWQSSWEESWLALGGWWALCLLSEPMLKFFFPLAALLVLAFMSHHGPPTVSQPATETTVHAVLSDLTVIHALLPSSSLSSLPLLPSQTLFRMAAAAYPPYLILTYFVPLHICIAITGTLVLIHRATWTRIAYETLARSAHLRWTFYHLRSLLFGMPLPVPNSPPPAYDSRPLSYMSIYASAPSEPATDDAEPIQIHPFPATGMLTPAAPVRFLFTVYENQRWWMGMDWTETLLPGERPSWCGPSHAPLPPPATFTLPAPSVAYVTLPGGSQVKRTARWAWEEPEWRVLVRRDGQTGAWRVEKTPPRDRDAPEDAAGTAARMLRAARPRDLGGSSGEQHVDESTAEDEVLTDQEGWVYGDNKWEGQSSYNGIGKYTRFRRWTRIARLTETVEPVSSGDADPAHNTDSATEQRWSSTAESFSSDLDSLATAPEQARDLQTGSTWSSLRQRFKRGTV